MAGVLAILAACTSTNSSTAVTSGVHPSSPQSSPTNQPITGGLVRTCQTSVYGDLGSGWRKSALAAGPIAFVGLGALDAAPAGDFGSVDGKYRSIKALAVVDIGVEVTVSVSPVDRPHGGLIYDPSAFRDDGLYSLGEGESAVTFQSCSEGQNPLGFDGPTQFNGGFIVDGPRCLTLDVAPDGEPTLQLVVSVGAGSCGSSG
jgi:hypothetical protein